MRLSLSERSRFYDELGKLLAAGFSFSRAVETMLSVRPPRSTRRILEKFQELALNEANLTESFSGPGMPFSEMEIALVSACERSGQMQRGCEFLERYYSRLDGVRRQIIRKALYPFFMLHFGIALLAVPRLFGGGTPSGVLREVAMQLGIFYLLMAAIWVLVRLIFELGVHSIAMDRILGFLPLLGGIRRSLALSRFCTTYQMQLDAGVNVMDGLESASRASASARIVQSVRASLPQIRAGQAVGPELARSAALPSELVRGIVIGEQTGTLDAELLRASNDYEARALRGIETLGEWVPKLIYFVIVGFLAFSIISAAKTTTEQLDQIIDSGG